MKNRVSIRELCSELESKYFENLEIENHTEVKPCPEKIRQIALAKLRAGEASPPEMRNREPFTEKRGIMKKKTVRVLLVAAAVCLLSVTAFAAFNGLDFFKSIFGNSAELVSDNIQSPMLSSANQEYKLSLESLLSDGYKTDLVLSLESLQNASLDVEPWELFTLATEDTSVMSSMFSEELTDFSAGAKKYYHVSMDSLSSVGNGTLTVSVNDQKEPLQIQVKLDGAMAAKTFQISPDPYKDQNYRPETVQLSPMGVLVVGQEKEAKGGLPTAEILVVMKDGSTEELISKSSFDGPEDPDEAPTMGGGGAVMVGPGQTPPLVTETLGRRNPGGKAVTSGSFSKILDLSQVLGIRVDGVDYPIGA